MNRYKLNKTLSPFSSGTEEYSPSSSSTDKLVWGQRKLQQYNSSRGTNIKSIKTHRLQMEEIWQLFLVC